MIGLAVLVAIALAMGGALYWYVGAVDDDIDGMFRCMTDPAQPQGVPVCKTSETLHALMLASSCTVAALVAWHILSRA